MTKQETAALLGYGRDVAAMDADHDPLHAALCAWLGTPSFALKQARGEFLTKREIDLACYEEDAVLAVQRFTAHAGLAVPTV